MTNQKQNLIKELGIDGLSEKYQDEILQKMKESVIKRIFADSIEKISENDAIKFIEKTSNPTIDEIGEFLATQIDDYDKIVQITAKSFKEELTNNSEKFLVPAK